MIHRISGQPRAAAGGGLCPPGGRAAADVCVALREGAGGGTEGSPTRNEWGYSCRLVDLVGKLIA